MDMQLVCHMLGLAETHINIQIFRARKQLQSLLQENTNTVDFVERRQGQIRFRFNQFIIYKGAQLESQMRVPPALDSIVME